MTTDNQNNGDSKKPQLTLGGNVKQNLSRVRSKTVKVEVRSSRKVKKTTLGGTNREQGLSSSEQEARLSALKNVGEIRDKEARAEQERLERIESEKRRAEQEARWAAERKAESEKGQVASKDDISAFLPERKKLKILEQAPEPSPEEIRKHREKTERTPARPSRPAPSQPNFTRKDAKPAAGKKKENDKRNAGKLKPQDKQRGKLTLSHLMNDGGERMRSLASVKRARQKAKRQLDDGEQKFIPKKIIITEHIKVQELSNRMAVRSQDVIKELMKLGMMMKGADAIDADTAELVVTELGHIPMRVLESDVESILIQDTEGVESESRPPIVTIMGHVDHGKTSLLDALRETRVTAGEAGGITQHIGAYQATTPGGDIVTFLDTPGHAAFTAMRARGASVTDIVILVVAADDGIMPQTVEAINHAKSANVPIIVAVNKIDKPEADPARVKNELLSHELVPEDLGGDIQVVEVSAKEKINLDGLLETIALQAEILELTASPALRGEGSVVEARLDKGKGVVATVLVQQGTLRQGDIVLAGNSYGKVRSVINDLGKVIDEAGPAMPVEILGLNEVPDAGDQFNVVEQEKYARDIIEYREKRQRDLDAIENNTGNNLENLFKNAIAGGKKELNIIVKGDVHGSVEAINASLKNIENDEVDIKIVHNAAGGITTSDVTLAAATNAMIIGFNVRAATDAVKMAQSEGVDIRYYNIIYNLIDDVKLLVGGMMSLVEREQYLGKAEIQQIFKMSKYGKVAGCLVRDGVVKRGSGVRLIRDDVVIHEGKLKTLRRFKDDVMEVKDNTECGMAFEGYEDMKDGDIIECFEIIEEKAVIA